MTIQFVGLPTQAVETIRTSRRDSYGDPVEQHLSRGDAYPCRHCLGETPCDQPYLVLAHRPFQSRNPYTETGPIFLCAASCTAAAPSDEVPAILDAAQYLVRGYTKDERILYGTGQVTETAQIADYAKTLLEKPEIAFVDVRSASNNCFLCRVLRAD